ncbi:TVP38/TMEM64 family inner membrane protein YdjZ [Pseudovibrio sp. Ad46]|uniref:TVP38/TMEM64 family protein n=1 Tax=unclassified Pseudovibrio TaxID=2627060 RepID=UPI00070E6DCB|nr:MULTISPECIES: VTT domain-containing protein [unclassified Pseudovibrio]KZK93892.1 TVP38/TMEM64 family inner membrane protein YdjZ [Pseudovibrio sp. Ad46]KZL00105.1 TVP38/TMEM64 family inner membrane protein YdjZ [Pseudovibrio sp. Ad5]KZL01228.1 TVP38/TMEM64 family inner membrane protein YdjZ [Pseudovibrio sp. W74]KZL11293.1 TVP38/TMEM64 family inner membrane protein YdjZ [Pseudovibrio sp. Ad14]
MGITEHNDNKSPAEGALGFIKRWGLLFVILAVSAYGISQGWHQQITISNLIKNQQLLSGYLAEYPILTPLIYFVVYTLAVALSFPGASLLTIAGGFLFGWFFGGLLTVLAATIGAALLFIAAKTSVGATLKARAGPFLDKMSEGFRKNAFSYLLFLRLTPVFPFWLVNIAPALFHVPLSTYLIATFVGIIPGTFAYAFVGAGLDSVILAQEQANPGCSAAGTCEVEISALITPELIWAFAALGLVALIPPIVQRFRGK